MSVKLDTIGIVVSNMKQSLDFYRTLGLPVPEGQEEELHVEFTNEEGYSIGFISEQIMKQTDPTWVVPNGQRISLQFKCDDVDAKYNELISAGYISFKAPWDAVWGQRFAQVLDPDGNNVGLFA